MPPRIEYQKGQKIGPYDCVFLKEIEPYIYPGGQKQRQAIFQCPYCNTNFKCTISRIRSGNTRSCGCQRKIQAKMNGQKCSKDITGQKFGYLTALYPTKKRENGHTIWKCRCDCGNENEISISRLISLKQKSCGLCGLTSRPNLVNRRFGKLTVLRYKYTDQYGNAVWECLCDCGNKKDIISSSLLKGVTQSCGCLKSKGEQSIISILNKLNIVYESEKKFNDCINPKTKTQLRFDFYLPNYNCCIEYDGIQHFEEKEVWSETLKDRQYRDNIKNQYCKDNNIKLIRIPYYDYNKLNEKYLEGLINDDIISR